MPDSGLANRMRAVASGVALAAKSGRQAVVVWHRDKGLNARFDDLFLTSDLPFELRETGQLPYALRYEKPRRKNLYISRLAPFFDGKSRIFQEHDSPEFNAWLERSLTGEERGKSRDVVIHSGFIFHDIDAALMNSIFLPAPDVERRMEEILQGRRPDAALQIRRTDNARAIEGSPLHRFEAVAEDLIEKNTDAMIFLATDDQPTKERLTGRFGSHIIFNPAPASRITKEGMVDAAAELYILSRSRHIYGSYWSSFSEIAALMGGAELTVVR